MVPNCFLQKMCFSKTNYYLIVGVFEVVEVVPGNINYNVLRWILNLNIRTHHIYNI